MLSLIPFGSTAAYYLDTVNPLLLSINCVLGSNFPVLFGSKDSAPNNRKADVDDREEDPAADDPAAKEAGSKNSNRGADARMFLMYWIVMSIAGWVLDMVRTVYGEGGSTCVARRKVAIEFCVALGVLQIYHLSPLMKLLRLINKNLSSSPTTSPWLPRSSWYWSCGFTTPNSAEGSL